MRAAVVVYGGQPGRAGVQRVRSWRRPCIELLDNGGPVHRRQPIRLTEIGDLHEASFHCLADILANCVWEIRRATTAIVIAHTRVTSRPNARTSAMPGVIRCRRPCRRPGCSSVAAGVLAGPGLVETRGSSTPPGTWRPAGTLSAAHSK